MIKSSNYTQFKYCNQQLAIKTKTDPKLRNKFTTAEINGMARGNNPKRYTWHHHEILGRMELVLTKDYQAAQHTGGKSICGKLY